MQSTLAVPEENLFGFTTHYGTHPRQPHPRRRRTVATVAGVSGAVAAATAAALLLWLR